MSTDNTDVQLPDPPHGGRFVRKEDGSLECTHKTEPRPPISEAPAPAPSAEVPAAPKTESPKE